MQFELRITGDDPGDLATLLAHLTEARQVVYDKGNGGLTQEAFAAGPQVGVPLTQEMFAAAARASQANAAPPAPAAAPTPPKARGRPRKDVVGTVVDGPDGEPAAVMTEPGPAPVDEPVGGTYEPERDAEGELPEGRKRAAEITAGVTDAPNFPVIKDDPLTPAEQRDKAIALLQSVFGKPQGPVEVRSLQTKFKIKKFNEVPDAMCKDLLTAAQDLHARIMATQG